MFPATTAWPPSATVTCWTVTNLLALTFEYDCCAAETALRRALELHPAHSIAHTYLAGLLAATGRMEESHRHQRRAFELDPASATMLCGRAAELIIHRLCRDALPFLDRALQIQPDFPLTYYWLAEAYLLLGEHDQLEILSRRTPPNLTAGFLGHSYARTGRTAEALSLLEQLEALPPTLWPALQIAVLHSGLGDHPAALRWLDRARQECCWPVLWLAVDPLWDPLRSEPGFRDLLIKLNLPYRLPPRTS